MCWLCQSLARRLKKGSAPGMEEHGAAKVALQKASFS